MWKEHDGRQKSETIVSKEGGQCQLPLPGQDGGAWILLLGGIILYRGDGANQTFEIHLESLPPERPQLPAVPQPPPHSTTTWWPRRAQMHELARDVSHWNHNITEDYLLNSANLTSHCSLKILPTSANTHHVNEWNLQRTTTTTKKVLKLRW